MHGLKVNAPADETGGFNVPSQERQLKLNGQARSRFIPPRRPPGCASAAVRELLRSPFVSFNRERLPA